jgi:hypothetical protein
MNEQQAMSDLGPILRNRSNNVASVARDYLILAAEAIEYLQHRVRHGEWPQQPPPEPEGNLE